MENKKSKIWTINVLVNTKFINSLSGKGTWENPIGSHILWHKNVTMTATNDDENDHQIYSGTGDNFALTISKGDTVRWIVGEINPLAENEKAVVMYGFKESDNWSELFTEPASVEREMHTVTIKSGAFNKVKEPEGKYYNSHNTLVSVPQTTVKTGATSGKSAKYLIKLLLVDTDKKQILKYAQVDPTLIIK